MVARVFIYCENETRGSPSRSTRAAVASVLEPSNCLRHCRRVSDRTVLWHVRCLCALPAGFVLFPCGWQPSLPQPLDPTTLTGVITSRAAQKRLELCLPVGDYSRRILA